MATRSQDGTYCAQRLKVLAEPHRLAILRLLFAGPKHVWELNDSLSIEQSLLSHHLSVLRQQGFVTSRRDSRTVLYELAPEARPKSGYGVELGCCTLVFDPKQI
ncbi:winged helix-turn-helix transcriptional regulator [Nodosilinea sp. LEGE 07298]|uniref:ArsR/SmtB family transcription factor n=1 Tax=Nodosilinea sp. LEGE 07298 TaxID=2777970 RepID=UPI0018802127|nr:metalloregulator ArsR/SmtB family transcription factor [Nodosilinea sp. LEGE 07298]MBE9111379.1 winged helix-turn-helix transcriptional regulator [Nodosilinea sp. LEGE 07298]